MDSLGTYSLLSPKITDLAIRQNGYGAQFDPIKEENGYVDHWLWENGLDDWPDTTKAIQFEINYNSHSWHWVRDPGSPSQCPENMRVCQDCGIEDSGHPSEFHIEYPHCGEVGD